tara:strand:+ start:107 stop:337 length:231 start_codon:yes stop_codon:yes gene_type:complete
MENITNNIASNVNKNLIHDGIKDMFFGDVKYTAGFLLFIATSINFFSNTKKFNLKRHHQYIIILFFVILGDFLANL